MTVKTLIQKLKQIPEDYTVLVSSGGDFFDIQRVTSMEKNYVEIFLEETDE
jgi:phosphoserine aminotransferase